MTEKKILKDNQVLIRIYFIDDTHKTLPIDPNNTTGDQLWDLVSEKIGINNKDAECFFIWAQNDDIEWLLFNHQNISEVINNWSILKKRYCNKEEETISPISSPKLLGNTIKMKIRGGSSSSSSGNTTPPPSSPTTDNTTAATTADDSNSLKSSSGGGKLGFLTIGKKKSSSTSTSMSTTVAIEHASKLRSSFPTLGEEGHFRLVYRPTSVLPLSLEKSIVSNEATHLFYIQAIHNVINSNYPCEEDIALKLASIQLQVSVGDHKAEHQSHFKESIDRYIPSHLKSKRKPEEWEALVIPQHTLLRGSDPAQLKRAYLETCQRWTYYGSTFFDAKYIPTNHSFFQQEFQGKVSLGVNGNGFHIIDPKAMKIVSYHYKDVLVWDSTPTSFTIQVNTNKSDPTKVYTFKTRQGELVNDLLHDWAVEWEKDLKK
ncbi:hypothetical protein CYY_000452 [Polysphondylium violaceum]|uniref:FERM domain-containing protein n=1 Tax=Polysphondylium violaceum TaxID=133409 RepID=A0A8J4Q3T9_9MYCE|nr:hypothetical protein CYY_000452 [Polysphondylium violaceum]